jgi:hypothetical protein
MRKKEPHGIVQRSKKRSRKNKFRVATGILDAITQGTYHDPISQIRELISNALDADADYFAIVSAGDTISFFDNGNGIHKDSFEHDYLPLGHSPVYGQQDKIGRFGIGVMAALPSCDRLLVFSRVAGKDIFCAAIPASPLFDPANRELNITDVFKYELLNSTVARSSAEWLRAEKTVGQISRKSEHFTCIVLQGVKGEMRRLSNPNLPQNNDEITEVIANMQMRLPLDFSREDPFLKKVSTINAGSGEKVAAIYNDPSIHRICIDWLIEKDEDLEPFRADIKHQFYGGGDFQKYPIEDFRVIGWQEVSTDARFRDIQFAAYLILNTRVISEPWQEPLVRLNNVFICSLDQLDRERDLHRAYPSRNYVAGEIFIKGVKDAIKITRESFDISSGKYRALWQSLVQVLNPYFQEAARKYELQLEASHFFIQEQNDLPEVIKTALEGVIAIWRMNTPGEIEEKFALVERGGQILRDRAGLDEDLAARIGEDILIYDNEDPDSREHVAYYMRPEWEVAQPEIVLLDPKSDLGHTADYRIRVSPAFFAPKEIGIESLGQVHILTKHGSAGDPAFETELSGGRKNVYINFFNQVIRSYTVSVFEVEAMLKAAAAETTNKDDFLEAALAKLRGQYKRKTRRTFDLINSFLKY